MREVLVTKPGGHIMDFRLRSATSLCGVDFTFSSVTFDPISIKSIMDVNTGCAYCTDKLFMILISMSHE